MGKEIPKFIVIVIFNIPCIRQMQLCVFIRPRGDKSSTGYVPLSQIVAFDYILTGAFDVFQQTTQRHDIRVSTSLVNQRVPSLFNKKGSIKGEATDTNVVGKNATLYLLLSVVKCENKLC